MATVERVIPHQISEDGTVFYPSVMSRSDDSIAVCYKVPDRVIPVIFVPGVMGSNLVAISGQYKNQVIWSVNEKADLKWWLVRGPETRKKMFDPATVTAYSGGVIPPGTAQSEKELRRRGWGTVANMSYGTFLSMLENALNDADRCKTGLRAQLMDELVAVAPGVSVLSHDEVALSYRYLLPVHAVGYNWLGSNADSAKNYLARKIEEFTNYYRAQKKACEKVIIVTHSMGGLVARYYSEVLGERDKVLGMVHGVMPTTGSATAYKRVTAGSDGDWKATRVLGKDAANVTAVFAQAPGPLQLLPSTEYGAGWLRIMDGEHVVALPGPGSDPYKDIYTRRDTWWGLVNDRLINPLDHERKSIDSDWKKYLDLIHRQVEPFHESMKMKFHHATYLFYGDGEKFRTWGDVIWKRKIPKGGIFNVKYPPMTDVLSRKPVEDYGEGVKTFNHLFNGFQVREHFILQDASENGDGTVPVRSGRAPGGCPGVRACVPFQDIDHESAYRGRTQQLFALWAITRIVTNVKGTSLEYLE